MMVERVTNIILTLSGTDTGMLKSILEKVERESESAGFNRLGLTKEEQGMVKDLLDRIQDDH